MEKKQVLKIKLNIIKILEQYNIIKLITKKQSTFDQTYFRTVPISRNNQEMPLADDDPTKPKIFIISRNRLSHEGKYNFVNLHIIKLNTFFFYTFCHYNHNYLYLD